MGYATKRVKRRRHAHNMRLHAAVVLSGKVRFSQWSLPYRLRRRAKGFLVKGYEIFLDDDLSVPYKNSLASAVALAAERLGVK